MLRGRAWIFFWCGFAFLICAKLFQAAGRGASSGGLGHLAAREIGTFCGLVVGGCLLACIPRLISKREWSYNEWLNWGTVIGILLGMVLPAILKNEDPPNVELIATPQERPIGKSPVFPDPKPDLDRALIPQSLPVAIEVAEKEYSRLPKGLVLAVFEHDNGFRLSGGDVTSSARATAAQLDALLVRHKGSLNGALRDWYSIVGYGSPDEADSYVDHLRERFNKIYSQAR